MSAIIFFWLGKITDQFDFTFLGLITLGVLGGFSFNIQCTNTLYAFFIFIRSSLIWSKYDQSYSHIAIARSFSKKRGRAMSIALMGHPIKALLPFFITFFLLQFTWREIWTGIGICIVIIFTLSLLARKKSKI